MRTAFAALAAAAAAFAADPAQEFQQSIRPVLMQNCAACHNPQSARGPNFLKANTAKDIESERGVWRNVAAQLRNRTMPPVDSKLAEEDRLRISRWVENQLRMTACGGGDYAGAGTIRRLNRREYRNTIRDLIGLDLDLTGMLPNDGTGGAGFDTNGETLYVPPLLMERYMESAQQILDRAIVTPPVIRTFTGSAATTAVYLDGDYDVIATVDAKDAAAKLTLKIDGADAGALAPRRGGRGGGANAAAAGPTFALQVKLKRGTHQFAVEGPALTVAISQRREEPSAEKRAMHYRLLGTEPGDEPLQARKAALQSVAAFLPRAFRRPIQPAEVNRFMAMYDRAAERGDPYEERVKLALKAALVWPDFLFRVEDRKTQPGIFPVGQYELASRLSYFLWSTMPDETLLRLADQGRLQDPKVLAAQVERMLDDPRARTFTSTFIGQWLGTQEIGGRVMPVLTETLSYYTLDVAADLKTQPVLFFDRIVGENRSVLDLIDGNYTYLTERLVKFYQLENQVKDVKDNRFHLVQWPDDKRAGVLGLAGVLGMASHYDQTSPVLRGAWVLETLLGTPVPPPPPNVPVLEPAARGEVLTTRQRVLQHRNDPACSACHKLMDPLGFGLENFDWMGRWRDKEKDGKPIDASGELPTGEKFNGPVELRQVLLKNKEDFVRQISGKVLGYALGRSLQDGDSCTVQRLVDTVSKDGYRARTLIREIVMSLPFRNTQGGPAIATPPPPTPATLSISSVTSKTQDAASHNNGEKFPPAKKK